MRRAVLLLGALVLLAACGGTDFSEAFPEPNPATSTTPTSRGGDEDDEGVTRDDYVEALRDALQGDEAASPLTSRQVECVAAAVVDGPGVGHLRREGVRPSDFRDVSYPAHFGPTLTAQQIEALGGALHECKIGELLAQKVGQPLSALSPRAVDFGCLTRAFDDPANTHVLAFMFTNTIGSTAEGRPIARIIIRCTSYASVLEDSTGLVLSGAEIDCVDRETSTSDALADAMADTMKSGNTAGTQERTAQAFGEIYGRCLTAEHLRQLADGVGTGGP